MSAPKLDRTPSIRDRVEDTLHAHRNELVALLIKYVNKGKCILQPHHILDALDEVQASSVRALAEGPFLDVLRSAQEAIVLPPFVAIAVRPRPGVWEYVRVNVHELSVEQLTISEYLASRRSSSMASTTIHMFLSLTSSHSIFQFHARIGLHQLEMECSFSTGICLLSCSATGIAWSPCWISSVATGTRGM